MKLLSTTIVALLFAMATTAQKQQLYSQIFTDSVLGTVFAPPMWSAPPKTYNMLAHTDAWAHRRFYFQPPAANQHHEGMNPYAYSDPVLAQRITKDEWNMLAHQALAQQPAKIKRRPANVNITSFDAIQKGGVFFSLTEPVFYKDWALIDLTYYQRDEEKSLPGQCYQGQALFVFNKQSHNRWKLIRVVNHYVL